MARLESTIVCISSASQYGFTLCISNDGEVYSFGRQQQGAHGHLEDTVHVPKQIPSLTHIKTIDCGYSHSITLDYEGNVYSFGSNSHGQLGVEKSIAYSHIPQKVDLPEIKQISCGYYFCACLSQDGDLFIFGRNNLGQLGNGTLVDGFIPQKVEYFSKSSVEIDFFSCCGFHTVCKSYENEYFVWGCNNYGQLGHSNSISKTQTFPIKCEDWPEDIIDIKGGFGHVLVLTSEQKVYSCGYNYYGQLGRPTTGTLEYSVSLQKVNSLSEITRIECGEYFSLCLDINGNLFIFGRNNYGQLGVGDSTNNIHMPTKHPSLSNIIDISAKGEHMFAKSLSNEIFACGNNSCSQLGVQTDKKYQLTPIQVFQDNEDIWHSNISKSRAKSARK